MQTQPLGEVFGIAVASLFAALYAFALVAISAVGIAVALVQRARRKAGRVNVVVAAIVLACAASAGGLLLATTRSALREPILWAPVLVDVAAPAIWLAVAVHARKRRHAPGPAIVGAMSTCTTSAEAEKRIAEWISTTMRGDRGPFVLRRGAAPLPLRIVPVQTSGQKRPDGLAEGAGNPGFGFAVAEAALEIDARAIAPEPLAAAHDVLSNAGFDDWMGYSHMGTLDAAAIARDPLLALTFSSAARGAGVVVLVLEALGVSGDEVEI